MRDLLGWAGLSYGERPLGEGSVFGLSGSLAFTYLRGPGLGTPVYLVGRGPTLTEQLCTRLEIQHEMRSTDDPVTGWEWVRDELDAGRPVLCWAEMAELPYLRVKMRMSRHDIVVIGYDEDAGTAIVVDNDRAEPQTIGLDALARARSGQGFPMPTRHGCYRLRFPPSLPDLRPVAASACAEASEGLWQGIGLPRPLPATVSGSGLEGVRSFVADLDRWDEVFPETELERALASLWAFIEKTGTGGALFRRLQAAFLAELAGMLPEKEILAAHDSYERLADAWSAVAADARNNSSPSARLLRVRSRARDLPELEIEGATRLAELASLLAG
jgi:hypothetical protein